MKGKILSMGLFFIIIFLSNGVLYAKQEDSKKEVVPLEEWKRNEKEDKKVRELIQRMDRAARKTKDLISFGFASMGPAKELYDMGISALPEMLNQIKNKELHSNTRFDLISHLPYIDGIEDYKGEVIDSLGKILLDKQEKDISVKRGICMYAFEEFKDTSATPYLIRVMQDKENPERVRWAAAHSFIFIQDERAVQSLLENVKSDSSIDVKRISISALGAVGKNTKNREMVRPLLEIAEKGKNITLQYQAISALGAMKEKRVIPVLLKIVKSEEKTNLYVTIWALGNIGGPKAKDALLKLLKDRGEEEFTRVRAGKALIKMDDKSITSDIEKAIESFEDEGAKKVLNESLNKLKKSTK